MKVIMTYQIGEQKQHLLWTMYDDGEHELNRYHISEFEVCDCFIDWIFHFRYLNNKVVYSEGDIFDFFGKIPTKNAKCDMFCLFGKFTIICCKNAVTTCAPCFIKHPEDKLTFHCSNCQVNFCKNVSNFFTKIKND